MGNENHGKQKYLPHWPSHPPTYNGISRNIYHLNSHIHNVHEGRVAEDYVLTVRWNRGFIPADEYAIVGDGPQVYMNPHVWTMNFIHWGQTGLSNLLQFMLICQIERWKEEKGDREKYIERMGERKRETDERRGKGRNRGRMSRK